MKKVSIKTLAEQLGVSKTTVSFVLNGLGDDKNISVSTQKKILDAARSMNYQPNHLARSLILGKSFTIGLIVPDISNLFFAKIGLFIEHFANKSGYSVMLASTKEDPAKEKKIVEVFISRQVDGIIIAPTMKNEDLRKNLSAINFPTIFFDRIDHSQKTSFVNIDNKKATKELAQKLIDKGHSRIGLISLTSYLPNIAKRIEGYLDALKDNEIEKDEELIFDVDFYNKKEGVRIAIDKMLNHTNPVSSILFINNVLAAEGIWNLNLHFKDKVKSLELASFDNLDLFDYSVPRVSSVIQPVKDIARHSVEMLVDLIENKTTNEGVVLKANLVNR